MMVEAPIDGLEAAIARLRAREAAKVAAQPVVERAALNAAAPIFTAPEVEAKVVTVPLKDLPLNEDFTKEVSAVDAPILEEHSIVAPTPEEPAAEAPIVATQTPVKAPKAPKVSKTVAKLTGPRDHKPLSKKAGLL